MNVHKNQKKSWDLWSYAAVRGQIDAQLKVAYFLSKGYDVITRDPKLANE